MASVLTGIKPSQTPHLGNYLGAIRPALRLAREHERARFFIADYHALTTLHDPARLRAYTYDVAATWLACGLERERMALFCQSAIPEVFELTWVLNCLVATGQLLRGHAYKDATAQDNSPNAGILNYPVLMAADIMLYDADLVPVGRDQKQHLELARDLAQRLNHLFGEGTVRLPTPHVSEAPLVPGTDGQKMSKSSGNSIPLFASPKELKKLVMRVVTGSEPLEAPKTARDTPVFSLYEQVAGPEPAKKLEAKLAAGGYGWGHAKADLLVALEAELGPMRARYETWRSDEKALDRVLDEGATAARRLAAATMERVRAAVGVRALGTTSRAHEVHS